MRRSNRRHGLLPVALALVAASLGACTADPGEVAAASPTARPQAFRDGMLIPDARRVEPTAIDTTTGHRTLTADFGRTVTGYVHLHLAARGGEPVTLTSSESGAWFDAKPGGDYYAEPWVVTADEVDDEGRWSSPAPRTFRFLRLDSAAPIGLDEVTVEFTPLPGADLGDRDALFPGWLHTSDETLNRIWQASAYTLQLSTIDERRGRSDTAATIAPAGPVIVDGAKRDRYVWAGDLVPSAAIAYVATGDVAAVRNSLLALAERQREDGKLPAAAIDQGSDTGIVNGLHGFDSYHLWWLIGYAEHWRHTADRDFLEQLWPTARDAMAWAATRISDRAWTEPNPRGAASTDLGDGAAIDLEVDEPLRGLAVNVGTYGHDVRLRWTVSRPDGGLVATGEATDVEDNAWTELGALDLPPGAYRLTLQSDLPAVWWGAPGRPSLRVAVTASDAPLWSVGRGDHHHLYALPGQTLVANVLYARALSELATIADELDRPAQATRWRAEHGRIVAAIDDEFWDPDRELYRASTTTTAVELLGNALAVRWRTAPPARAERILDRLQDHLGSPFGPTAGDARLPLYGGHRGDEVVSVLASSAYLDALFAAGRTAQADRLLRDLWGWMYTRDKSVDDGTTIPAATTGWEHVRVDGQPIHDGFTSLAHPWAGAPAATLSTRLLGIAPQAPGWGHIRLRAPALDLDEIDGAIPTPHGAVRASWRRAAEGWEGTVDLPDGVVAAFDVPNCPDIVVDGRLAEDGSRIVTGTHRIRLDCR